MYIKTTSLMALLFTLVVSACSEKTIDPLCDGRARALQPNNANLVLLKMNYGENKAVDISLEFLSALSAAEQQHLNAPESLFSLGGSEACALTQSDVNTTAGKLVASYRYACGESNALKEVDIKLLDKLSSIDEVEAFITTDAVSKHFVISRQCSKPIFNLASASHSE